MYELWDVEHSTGFRDGDPPVPADAVRLEGLERDHPQDRARVALNVLRELWRGHVVPPLEWTPHSRTIANARSSASSLTRQAGSSVQTTLHPIRYTYVGGTRSRSQKRQRRGW